MKKETSLLQKVRIFCSKWGLELKEQYKSIDDIDCNGYITINGKRFYVLIINSNRPSKSFIKHVLEASKQDFLVFTANTKTTFNSNTEKPQNTGVWLIQRVSVKQTRNKSFRSKILSSVGTIGLSQFGEVYEPLQLKVANNFLLAQYPFENFAISSQTND